MLAAMNDGAIVLANDLLADMHGKTAHGLIRGPSRWPVIAVVDATCAGQDAGEVLDGKPRGIPVFSSVRAALDDSAVSAGVCVLGIATSGGRIPASVRSDLVEAARAGLTLVSGMHQLLSEDEDLRRLAGHAGGRIVDLRKPRPSSELRFWTGEGLSVRAPRVAVLGTDCALGKRTTCQLLLEALRTASVAAEMVYTGQTGWMQGLRHGFILDATPNDFVPGELERAILACSHETDPDVILLEGQSALRNPSGPCGAELIVSAGAAGVVLQHAPGRRAFQGLEDLDAVIPPIQQEVEMIRLLGAEVWAITLHDENLDADRLESTQRELAQQLDTPVLHPLRDGLGELAAIVSDKLGLRSPR